jgi:hypothetical protein
MSDNLKIWDALRRPPSEALKGFKRGGGFSGTAIKPMWSIQAMTEHFGPCGKNWGIDEPTFQIVDGTKEKLVFCTVSVWWVGGGRIYGVGGDKIIKYIKPNPQYNTPERYEDDDEAFKKAYTDAITNALKHLGVGADIHMGLWDGSKYADDSSNESQKGEPILVSMPKAFEPTIKSGLPLKDKLCLTIDNFASLQKLQDWGASPDTLRDIQSLHRDLADVVRQSYSDKIHELKQKAAA